MVQVKGRALDKAITDARAKAAAASGTPVDPIRPVLDPAGQVNGRERST
jgi:hypothetical protein